nr:hypothetical protein [Tanacetum cinerariifolium]
MVCSFFAKLKSNGVGIDRDLFFVTAIRDEPGITIYGSDLLILSAYALSMSPLLLLPLSMACDNRDAIRIMVIAIVIGAFSISFYFMRIVVISIVKGYNESERLRKRQDYPQLGVATYCIYNHDGCVLCLRLFAYLSLLYNHVADPYICDWRKRRAEGEMAIEEANVLFSMVFQYDVLKWMLMQWSN